jgi:hypothetical protein
MSITDRDREKLSLERFGCTFRESTGVFLIDWRAKRAAQVSSANIFACLGHARTERGPIVLMAIQISSVRPLPSYSYFPFDLKKQAHREYLSRSTETGEIRLLFLTRKRDYERVHRLTPYLRSRASEIYAEMSQEWETIEPDKYDFGRAQQLMERHVRIPEFVDRMLLEDSIREISESEQAIQAVPSENRELAKGASASRCHYFPPGSARIEG